MKKGLLFLLLSMSTQFSFGKELLPPIYLKSDLVDNDLSSVEAVFRFQMSNVPDHTEKNVLRISLNGVWKKVTLKSDRSFELKVSPGKYIFQFFWNENYQEIYSDSLMIKSKHKMTYGLTFSGQIIREMAEKPVVYCYAPAETPLSISVHPKGEFTFTYPPMNDQWKGKVKESGGFEIDGITYPYLFWEASHEAGTMKIDWSTSSKIKGSESLLFLEEVCEKLGLTSTEKTDFITYWGPRMTQKAMVEVCVVTNEVAALIGELTVSDPEFKVNRMFMVFREIAISETNVRLNNLVAFERPKKSILEWGGSEYSSSSIHSEL